MKKVILLSILVSAANFNNLIAQTTTPAPYCVADFDDNMFNVPDAIKSVSFGTLTNVSNGQYALPHYVFYNNLATANFIKGTAYNLSVTFEVNGGCGYGVWIDYNHDNQFDASEKVSGTDVVNSMDITANTLITESITIPTNAMTGPTRMRVRIVEDDNYTMGANGYSILPCNASTSTTDVMDWGETEDYTINIDSPLGITDVSTANNFTISPNPVTTTLTVMSANSSAVSYKIVSMTGIEVQSGTINTIEEQINVSTLTAGVYFIQLVGDKPIAQERFIKTTNN